MNRRTFLAGCSTLLAGVPAVADSTKSDITRLIDQLGSDKFREREAASKALEKMGEKALPALRKAVENSLDTEVQRRAQRLVDALEKKLGLSATFLRAFTGHTKPVNAVAFSSDGRWVLSASDDDKVRLWDVATGRQVFSSRYGDAAFSVFSLACSPVGKIAVLGGYEEPVRCILLPSGKQVRLFKGHELGGIHCVTFSPDGQQVLSVGGGENTIRLWDTASGKELQCIRGYTNAVHVVFVPACRNLLSAGLDGTVRLWTAVTGKELKQFAGHTGWVNSVAVARTGRLAVSGGNDETVRLWDLRTGEMYRCLRTHTGEVKSVAFTPDGKRVLSAGGNTLRRWDVTTGKQLHCFTVQLGNLRSMSLSSDGHLAVSGGSDKTVRLWRLPP